MTTFLDYKITTQNMSARIEALGSQNFIKREVAYFRENISKISSGDELMNDYRLYNFAMKAFGLEEQIYAKGLMRKVFDEGVKDTKAMANLLTDGKFKDIASAFGFAETGNLNMLITSNVEDVVHRYMQLELEIQAGESNQGVRLALYFQRMAPNIDNWYEVLGDPALAEVVRTAFGLPDEFAQTNIDKQAAYFEERLSIEDMKNPEKLHKFLQRFTALWDVSGKAPDMINLAAHGIAPIAPLGSNTLVSIDPSLLAELGRYKI